MAFLVELGRDFWRMLYRDTFEGTIGAFSMGDRAIFQPSGKTPLPRRLQRRNWGNTMLGKKQTLENIS
jgi:hypothetical protein